MNNDIKLILQYCINEENAELTYSEIKGYIEELEGHITDDTSAIDFLFEFEGVEHRIILESEAFQIAYRECEETLKGCYYELEQSIENACNGFMRHHVSIDWTGAAIEAVNIDGLGRQFNYHHGGEKLLGNFYIFRLGA